jgi:hypothetical protein
MERVSSITAIDATGFTNFYASYYYPAEQGNSFGAP